MLPIPSAIDKAKQLIKDNPHIFFKNDAITNVVIAQALLEYGKECYDIIYNSIHEIILKPDTDEKL